IADELLVLLMSPRPHGANASAATPSRWLSLQHPTQARFPSPPGCSCSAGCPGASASGAIKSQCGALATDFLQRNVGMVNRARSVRGCTKKAALPAGYPEGRGWGSERSLHAGRPDYLDAKVTDFFAQRIAIEPEKFSGADLIAARRRQRRSDQRKFDLP